MAVIVDCEMLNCLMTLFFENLKIKLKLKMFWYKCIMVFFRFGNIS